MLLLLFPVWVPSLQSSNKRTISGNIFNTCSTEVISKSRQTLTKYVGSTNGEASSTIQTRIVYIALVDDCGLISELVTHWLVIWISHCCISWLTLGNRFLHFLLNRIIFIQRQPKLFTTSIDIQISEKHVLYFAYQQLVQEYHHPPKIHNIGQRVNQLPKFP